MRSNLAIVYSQHESVLQPVLLALETVQVDAQTIDDLHLRDTAHLAATMAIIECETLDTLLSPLLAALRANHVQPLLLIPATDTALTDMALDCGIQWIVPTPIAPRLLDAQIRHYMEHHVSLRYETPRVVEALYSTALVLSSTLDMESVLDRILGNLSVVLPYDLADVMLLDDETAYIVRHRGYEERGYPAAPNDVRFTTNSALASDEIRYADNLEYMVRTGDTWLISDVTRYDGWIGDPPEIAWIRSYLGAPLFMSGTVVGFLNVCSGTVNAYSEKDAQTLQVFASQVSVAITNAQLVEQIKQNNAELEQRVVERTADLIKALRKERELNEMKSRFVATVSHQFRTPLTAILSANELLSNYSHRMDETQKARRYEIIRQGVREMEHLIQDTLTLNNATEGQIEFAPVPLNIDTFTRDVVAEFAASEGQNHRIEYHSDHNAGVTPADPGLWRKIVEELLTNAVHYSPADSEIFCEVASTDESVILRVRDQGMGIPKVDQPHIFDMFYRAMNVSNLPGTGLGLPLVKLAVELHGGSISLESSEAQRGTTITVTLPRIVE